MNNSRKKNAILNILIGYGAQIGILVLSLLGRRIFLQFLSVEYLGINGLYSNILTILSLAELGLDSAVVFSLYKPVAENNTELIYSLVRYFKKIYFSLAAIIFTVGLCLIPFLRFIINSTLSNTEVIAFYVLILLNNVLSYFVAHKVAILSACQEQRYHKVIMLTTTALMQVLHILVLMIWSNYYVFLFTTIVTTLIGNCAISIICEKKHSNYFEKQKEIEFDKKPIIKRIYSTFLYKIGAVAVNNTDNILISTFVSTAAVGLYSNYYIVISSIQGFITIINQSMISAVGNLAALDNQKRQHQLFDSLLLFYHTIGAIGGIGFGLLFNSLITIWLGSKFLLDQPVVFVIAFNFYLTTATSPIWMFREANGLFEKVKYLVLIRAMVNLSLSLLLATSLGTFGILLATGISLLLTSFWYEPKILFGCVFNTSSMSYWIKQSKYLILTVLSGFISWMMISRLNIPGLFGLVCNALIIIVITGLMFILVNAKTSEFLELYKLLARKKN